MQDLVLAAAIMFSMALAWPAEAAEA
ncbi:MAG: hypothetical protein JWN13_3763, partial [Betaproteobacteria bacterium]|nr:hypothetical protein [Betaproteobacteria bacterium]